MRAPRRTTSLWLVGVLSLALACPVLAEPLDPLLPLILRMNGFLHRGETDGVTRDPRTLRHPPEEIRLSVIPQHLG